MSRRTPLWSTSDVEAYRFDHAPDDHDHGPVDEIGTRLSASIVETGCFDVEIDGRAWRLEPGDVLLVHPGMRFRILHPAGALSDACLSVSYLAGGDEDRARCSGWGSPQPPVRQADNRLRYLYRGLRQALDSDRPMFAETCAAALFQDIPRARPCSPRARRRRTFEQHARRISHAQERLDAEPTVDIRLDALARDAGMSTFHFARVFAELVGRPPHQYLLDARLRLATRMLDEGRNVTDTCFSCGFNDPAHFSRIFSERFGRPPSAWRRHRSAHSPG